MKTKYCKVHNINFSYGWKFFRLVSRFLLPAAEVTVGRYVGIYMINRVTLYVAATSL